MLESWVKKRSQKKKEIVLQAVIQEELKALQIRDAIIIEEVSPKLHLNESTLKAELGLNYKELKKALRSPQEYLDFIKSIASLINPKITPDNDKEYTKFIINFLIFFSSLHMKSHVLLGSADIKVWRNNLYSVEVRIYDDIFNSENYPRIKKILQQVVNRKLEDLAEENNPRLNKLSPTLFDPTEFKAAFNARN